MPVHEKTRYPARPSQQRLYLSTLDKPSRWVMSVQLWPTVSCWQSSTTKSQHPINNKVFRTALHLSQTKSKSRFKQISHNQNNPVHTSIFQTSNAHPICKMKIFIKLSSKQKTRYRNKQKKRQSATSRQPLFCV